MSENVIQIQHISKCYKLYEDPRDRFKEAVGILRKVRHKEFYALHDISFEVKKGETVGIIGTNGSGKSTLLKIITGVLNHTSGSVRIQGKVSALLELGAGFHQEYTGMQNIFLNGRMMGYTKKEMEKRIGAIIEFADIGNFINQPVKTYSSGMFARLAFAVAINVEPDILIVDEALSVGDLFFQNKCFRKFEELKKNHVTILFVSHDIASVRQMCSRALWIEKGEQKMFDRADKVCNLYMDQKRIHMNELEQQTDQSGSNEAGKSKYLEMPKTAEERLYPRLRKTKSALSSEKVEILSVFITDKEKRIVNQMEVENQYTFHVVIQAVVDLDQVIVGVVVENNKGIPLYDFNNYIQAKKALELQKNTAAEVEFTFVLPRIMKGKYVVAAAVAQGTQEHHQMLTWLHAVLEIEIINKGYNSSYIEIPAKVRAEAVDRECIRLFE